jgi:hypothetical protein
LEIRPNSRLNVDFIIGLFFMVKGC